MNFCICVFLFKIYAVVLCPLSVTDGWISEMEKFAPKLKVLRYVGEKDHRRSLRKIIYEQVKEQSDVSFDPAVYGQKQVTSSLWHCIKLSSH